MSDLVLLTLSPPIATITLNRPVRHNSLIPELLEAFLAVLQTIREQTNIRAVVLQANGRSFSTGGDVKAFYLQRDNLEAYAGHIVGLLNEVILQMVTLPLPVITAVHGIVTGGSLGLVLASDLVLVAPEATFTPWYSVVGFSPDGGWTAMLPEVIGKQRTASILIQNSTISAKEAVTWGIASQIEPATTIRSAAATLAKKIAANQPGSIRHTKSLLTGSSEPNLRTRLESEREKFVSQIVTNEAQDGMAAFLQM